MAEAEAKPDVFLQSNGRRDFALLVEGKKIYVDRSYLSNWSPVFEKIFYPEGAPFNQPEGGMEMKGKKLAEFLTFLHAVFPTSDSDTMVVDESNVATLVAYADEYDVGALRKRCDKFMHKQLKKSRVVGEGLIDYLRLTSLYNYKDLQKQLVPLVAQLSIDQLEASHEMLPATVLAAVFHSKASALQTAVDSPPTLPKGALFCWRGCSKTCTISKGASSCCNKDVWIRAKDAAELERQWQFTCSKCQKSCSLKPVLTVFCLSSCCDRGVFVKPKNKVCKKRSASAYVAAPSSKAARFSAQLLDRNH